jgi:hypothetical protein
MTKGFPAHASEKAVPFRATVNRVVAAQTLFVGGMGGNDQVFGLMLSTQGCAGS